MSDNIWLFCGDDRLGMKLQQSEASRPMFEHPVPELLLNSASCPTPALADDMNARLAQAINGNRDGFRDPFVSNLKLLRRFFINLQQEPGWADADIMVFIDTNPAFTEYTQPRLRKAFFEGAGASV